MATNNRKAVFYMAHCAETDEQARANAEKDAPVRPGVEDDVDTSMFTMDYMMDNYTAICGSPDTCIRQIEEITKSVKVDQMMLMQQFWAMPHEQTMKSIELFGKHIIPHFEKKAAATS